MFALAAIAAGFNRQRRKGIDMSLLTKVRPWRMLLLALVVAGFALVGSHADTQAAHPPLANPGGHVLILAPSVWGPTLSSLEATKAVGWHVDPVPNFVGISENFGGPHGGGFHDYRAIILGDPNCGGASTLATVEIAAGSLWQPAVNGNVVIIGTDPRVHQSQGGDVLTEKGIAFATDDATKTGAYITLSCYGDFAAPATDVPLLSGLSTATPVPDLGVPGGFTMKSAACFNNVAIVATHPALTSSPALTNAALSGWNCSIHETFDSYPTDFLPLAIAAVGPPYIMARGEGLSPLCARPPNRMQAWWPLDEKKGAGTINDIVVGNHNGTPMPGPYNAAMFGAGMVGGSLHFLDSTTFVQVPTHAKLEPGSGDFSIDAWVYPVTPPNVPNVIQPIVDKWDPAFNNNIGKGYAFYIQNAELMFQYSDGTVAGTGTVSSIATLPYDQWSHVAVTLQRSGGSATVQPYIKGQPEGGVSVLSLGAIANGKDLRIGSTQQLPLPALAEIALDEVEIFDAAVSPEDIAAIYNAGSAGKCEFDRFAVGGIVELRADGTDPSALAAESSAGSAADYAAIAGGIGAGVLALAAGGWYTRRRWMR